VNPCHFCKKGGGQDEREITSPIWRAFPSHHVASPPHSCRELGHPRRNSLRASLASTTRICLACSSLTWNDEEIASSQLPTALTGYNPLG